MPYPIITISGNAGSGKSTTAQKLAELLKAERIYAGGVRRDIAQAKGMSLSELNHYALEHPETDVDVDKAIAAQAVAVADKKIVVVEGRVQFHFLPQSIKIFLKVDLAEGARRIWQQMQTENNSNRTSEDKVNSLDEMVAKIQAREANDQARYHKYYKLDHIDATHYDLVVDTTELSADAVIERIMAFLKDKIR